MQKFSDKIEYAKILAAIDPEDTVGVGFLKNQIRESVELNALSALVETGHVDEEIINRLKMFMSGDNERDAINSAGVLVQIEPQRKEAVEFLLAKLNTRDFQDRFSVAQSLANVGVSNEESIRTLTMMALSKDEMDRRTPDSARAVEALGKLGPDVKAALPELQILLYDEDEEARWDALKAIKLITGK